MNKVPAESMGKRFPRIYEKYAVTMKGHNWLVAKQVIKDVYGAAGLVKLENALAPEIKEVFFKKMVMATAQIDYGDFIQMLLTADTALGKGDLEAVKHISELAAEAQFKGFLKFFMMVSNTQSLMNNFPKTFKQQYGRGTAAIFWDGESQAQMKVEDFPAPLHHERIEFAFHARALSLSGAKDVIVTHPKCFARGDGYCLYRYSWK